MTRIVGAASIAHRIQMEALGRATEADTITYKDLGNGEDYAIDKGTKRFIISARGNKDQGGFLCVQEIG